MKVVFLLLASSGTGWLPFEAVPPQSHTNLSASISLPPEPFNVRPDEHYECDLGNGRKFIMAVEGSGYVRQSKGSGKSIISGAKDELAGNQIQSFFILNGRTSILQDDSGLKLRTRTLSTWQDKSPFTKYISFQDPKQNGIWIEFTESERRGLRNFAIWIASEPFIFRPDIAGIKFKGECKGGYRVNKIFDLNDTFDRARLGETVTIDEKRVVFHGKNK